MKKIIVVFAVVALVVSLTSFAFAAGMESMQKGTIKNVDAKAGTVVFCAEGSSKDVTLKADKSVDLTNLKTGQKVEVSIENNTLMHVMAAPAAKKAPVGC